MSPQLYAFLEPVIVTLIVLVSVASVIRKHAPKLWTRLTGKQGGGAACHDDSSAACGSACGACSKRETATEHRVQIHRS